MILLLALLGCRDPDPGPHVYALSYGRSWAFPRQTMVADASPGSRGPGAWMVWLIRDEGRNILVDTGGTDPELLDDWHVSARRTAGEALDELGLGPDDIDDVVLTHLHWDHAGGVREFPRATVHVQAEALRWARQQVSGGHGQSGVDPEDLVALQALGERLDTLHGDARISPHVRVHREGGHTPGVQWVQIDAPDGVYAIASDIAYSYENLERRVPPGGSLDPEADLGAIEHMLALTGVVDHVIPGHDPEVFRRNHLLSGGAARLR